MKRDKQASMIFWRNCLWPRRNMGTICGPPLVNRIEWPLPKTAEEQNSQFIYSNYLHTSWNPEICHIQKGSIIIPILSRINASAVLKPISLRSILILFSHLRLGLPKGIFPVGVHVKILKEIQLSSILAT